MYCRRNSAKSVEIRRAIMKINGLEVIETKPYEDGSLEWMIHTTSDGSVWLDTDPDNPEGKCSLVEKGCLL